MTAPSITERRARARRGHRAALVALTLVAVTLCGCADTRITWRSAERHPPLAADAPIALFVRSSAPDDLKELLLVRGAEEVAAFPPGERVAEFASISAPWIQFDTVLDDVRTGARAVGADIALATGSQSGGTGEEQIYFQLLRSKRAAQAARFDD